MSKSRGARPPDIVRPSVHESQRVLADQPEQSDMAADKSLTAEGRMNKCGKKNQILFYLQ